MICEYDYVDDSKIPYSVSYEIEESDYPIILEELKDKILDGIKEEYTITLYCEKLCIDIDVEVKIYDYLDDLIKFVKNEIEEEEDRDIMLNELLKLKDKVKKQKRRRDDCNQSIKRITKNKFR